jgi:hypothetical protein
MKLLARPKEVSDRAAGAIQACPEWPPRPKSRCRRAMGGRPPRSGQSLLPLKFVQFGGRGKAMKEAMIGILWLEPELELCSIPIREPSATAHAQ